MTAAKLVPVVPADDSDRVTIDMDSLTCGEIETAEELSGMPITHALDPDKPKGTIMRALGCVVRQRTDPSFTWDQAASLKVFFGSERSGPPSTGRGSSISGRGSSTGSRSRNTSPS